MSAAAAIKSPYHPETAEPILRGFDAGQGGFSALRRAGAAYLAAHGLPTPKLEGWKYTNLIPRVRDYAGPVGVMRFDVSPCAGVVMKPLVDAPDWARALLNEDIPADDKNTEPSLAYLANAFMRDGVVLDVAKGTVLAEPLTIDISCDQNVFSAGQMVVRVGENARLTFIETHAGKGRFWKTMATRIVLAQGAKLTHVRVQDESVEAVHTQVLNIEIGRDAVYESVTLSTGAALSRQQMRVEMMAPGGVCHINGASLTRGTQHTDMTVLVDHHAPHCESNQAMRTILDDHAHGVFQGKIHVYKDAQKTNGYQLSKALILSEGAEMDTKPELEIYADDVKCSHGATTGRLDEEPLFYMQSRGIDRDAARALLVQAFATEALALASGQAVYDTLLQRVESWLRQ